MSFRLVLAATFTVILLLSVFAVEARYLPTRGQDDRLERLRELLKDVLETDMDRADPPSTFASDRRMYYKRDMSGYGGHNQMTMDYLLHHQ